MMKATHIAGGNYFDNITIDIVESYLTQDEWLKQIDKKTVRKSALLNYMNLATYLTFQKLGLHESLINNNIRGRWFEEFCGYWSDVLNGRPLTIMDFHHLHFLYRTRIQHTAQFQWEDYGQHLRNWQTPDNISSIFHYVYKLALHPVRSQLLWKLLKNGMRVVEYGCALAPMYRTWRDYLNHIHIQWVLTDIPNFPFHYARHLYGRDEDATLITIAEDLFDEPLKNVQGSFDLIIVQEVFEHLHNPLQIAEYLIDRLAQGGMLYFDYIRSEAVALDTPIGLRQRTETLQYLGERLKFIHGNFQVNDNSLSGCVGVKIR